MCALKRPAFLDQCLQKGLISPEQIQWIDSEYQSFQKQIFARFVVSALALVAVLLMAIEIHYLEWQFWDWLSNVSLVLIPAFFSGVLLVLGYYLKSRNHYRFPKLGHSLLILSALEWTYTWWVLFARYYPETSTWLWLFISAITLFPAGFMLRSKTLMFMGSVGIFVGLNLWYLEIIHLPMFHFFTWPTLNILNGILLLMSGLISRKLPTPKGLQTALTHMGMHWFLISLWCMTLQEWSIFHGGESYQLEVFPIWHLLLALLLCIIYGLWTPTGYIPATGTQTQESPLPEKSRRLAWAMGAITLWIGLQLWAPSSNSFVYTFVNNVLMFALSIFVFCVGARWQKNFLLYTGSLYTLLALNARFSIWSNSLLDPMAAQGLMMIGFPLVALACFLGIMIYPHVIQQWVSSWFFPTTTSPPVSSTPPTAEGSTP